MVTETNRYENRAAKVCGWGVARRARCSWALLNPLMLAGAQVPGKLFPLTRPLSLPLGAFPPAAVTGGRERSEGLGGGEMRGEV